MGEATAPLGVGPAIIRLTTAVGERVLEARAASGMSALQLQVLRLTAGGTNMSTLTHILGTPKSTMTSVVDQLETLGLVVRATDDEDHRRHLVHGTSAGATLLREFDLALIDRIDAMVVNLSPIRARRLRELMAKLPDATAPVPLSGPR